MPNSIVLVCLIVGTLSCGGKTLGEGAGAAGTSAVLDAQPAPTCTTICDRLVSLCAGSPNASCQSDCEATRIKYALCPAELARFLKCMGATHVKCTPGEVVVIDCSDERVVLERCGA